MIKKILLWGTLILAIACVVAYFYFSSKLNESFPNVINASESMFIESCISDNACTQEVKRLFQECKNNYTLVDVSLFTFQEESTKFFTVVNKCIQDNANVKVPSIWQYMMEGNISE